MRTRSSSTYVSVLVDGVTRSKVIAAVHLEIDDLRVSGGTKRLGGNERRVVDRAGRPLTEGRLVGRWWGEWLFWIVSYWQNNKNTRTNVIVHVLTTNVEEDLREVCRRELERKIC